MNGRLIVGACAAVLSAAALIAACGGGGYSSPSGPTAVPPGGGGGGASTTISILGIRGSSSFSPNPASVNQGSTVAWRNTDSVTHHIVLDDGSLDAGNIAPGATSPTMTLNENGARYHCTIHPSMVGSINTSSGTPPPCSGAYC